MMVLSALMAGIVIGWFARVAREYWLETVAALNAMSEER